MQRDQALELIRRTGVIAILRAERTDRLLQAAEAIRAGGVQAIEVSLTTPGALEVITEATRRAGDDLLFGAGTVLDAETARAAILAGAQFVVAPTLDPATIALCRRYSIPAIPGAYTPTEVLAAWQAGADLVKVFPASVGGPDWIRALKGPLPQVQLVPVGGVTLSNAGAFIRAGAAALGVGSALAAPRLIEQGDFATLTARAQAFADAIAEARAH